MMIVDYEASIQRLIKHISFLVAEKAKEQPVRWPTSTDSKIMKALSTPKGKYKNLEKYKLQTLSAQLQTTLNFLERDWFEFQLEDDFNADNVEIDPSIGWRIETLPEFSRAGSYKSLLWELRRLKEVCDKQANEYPPIPHHAHVAAHVLLLIMYECDENKPSKYEGGRGVTELHRICQVAGSKLTIERLKGIFSEELDNFDPGYSEYWDFIVYVQ